MNDDRQAPEFEPKVVAFCCTYCAYTAADLAGSMRLSYTPSVRVIKIECTGKIDAVLLLRAFEHGADAVYVAGCALGDCHFLEGNLWAIRTVAWTGSRCASPEGRGTRPNLVGCTGCRGGLWTAPTCQSTMCCSLSTGLSILPWS